MAGRVEIPPEHSALKSLEQIFRAAGEEKDRIRRLERRRVRRRAMLATVAAVAAASGSAAIATKVLDSDDPPVRAGDAAVGELAPAPADRRLALATAADPVERHGWGVRIYQGRTGETCAVAGRLLQGRLGVIQNGRFRELPAGVPGQCTDLAAEHALVTARSYGAGSTAGAARTVVYGIVDRTVTRVGIGRTASERQIPVAADGTFVYVMKGARALTGQRAFVARADGVRSLPLGRLP
jgi:hypothetical protein